MLVSQLLKRWKRLWKILSTSLIIYGKLELTKDKTDTSRFNQTELHLQLRNDTSKIYCPLISIELKFLLFL